MFPQINTVKVAKKKKITVKVKNINARSFDRK